MRVWQLLIVMLTLVVLALSLSWSYIDVESMEHVTPFGVNLDPNEPGTPNES